MLASVLVTPTLLPSVHDPTDDTAGWQRTAATWFRPTSALILAGSWGTCRAARGFPVGGKQQLGGSRDDNCDP